jgi:hypothetical protein
VLHGNTYTLLKRLCILRADANPPRPTEVPRSLSRQILDHDAGQNSDFGFDIVQDAVVGQVETIRNLLACPI